MTGILVCDKCHKLFFVHGRRESLPKELQHISLFHGVREIRSEKQTHSTVSKFDDYCNDRLNCGASYGYRMVRAGRLAKSLLESPNGQIWLPANERQARELAKLPEDQVEAAIEIIVGHAPKKGGEPQVTAQHIKETLLQEKFIKPRRRIPDEERQKRADQGIIRQLRNALDTIAAVPWSGAQFIEQFGYAQLGRKFQFVRDWLDAAEAAQQARNWRDTGRRSEFEELGR